MSAELTVPTAAGGEVLGHPRGHDHVTYRAAELPDAVDVYDTTLRDGSQQEGMSLTVEDKLRVAEQLDHLGVAYVEGGWPGANPKDEEFFARARDELKLSSATLVAFGSTRRPGSEAGTDETLRHLVAAGTEVVCIVAKSSDLHVIETLRTDLDEAVAMVADSVAFLRSNGLRVFLDAEHFFDGYLRDREFALRVLGAAEERGAEALVLCDTNGGTLPHDVERVVAEVRAATSATLGVHFHNDSGCAVANTLTAVRFGATQVQGCVNGYGERAGNADLSAAIPNLTLKMGVRTIPRDRLELVTPVARHIAELVNVNLDPQRPYVGGAVFAHKAGLHASAIARRADAYEHVPPDSVGNGTRFVVSELAGRSTLALKAAELGIELDSDALGAVLDALKRLEHGGYHFEVADGSLELLMRAAAGGLGAALDGFFTVESFRVSTDWRAAPGATAGSATDRLVHPWASDGELVTEATVKVHVAGQRVVSTAEGNGPVNALDAALRQAIGPYYPELSSMHLTDYRVRVLDTAKGTAAVTRVLLDTADPDGSWSTIGVSENVIESSWHALVDAVVFGLFRASAVATSVQAEA
ncbi:MAG: 2-isopropylmalate synthase/homocitrate synthase family protein [Acidimicrobiaceae bacterium]|nr:2-isopropylmalate synthase/homocitrate synthase family protein [Acidimicrobiaceae bacterium]